MGWTVRRSNPVGVRFSAPVQTGPEGTRIVQADSFSDSDSESRNRNEEIIPVNRLTQTVCTDPPAPATTILVRTRTVKQRTFFAPTDADSRNRSRNLNLPALYAYPEAHPASCTMGTGSFPGVRCGRGVTLTHRPLLVPR